MEEVQEVSEENALKAKITKSATEKCDREIVSKMKAFQDLKGKRVTAEDNEEKLQLAMKETDSLIEVQQNSLNAMKDMASGGLGIIGLGAVGLGTLGLGIGAVGGLVALGGVGVLGGLGALGGLASWGHKSWNLASLVEQRRKLEVDRNALQTRIQALQRQINSLPESPGPDESVRRKEELDSQIALKEEELECWCCYSTCTPPIFTCRSQHPVCSSCRSRLDKCGLCKTRFEGKQRHRWA